MGNPQVPKINCYSLKFRQKLSQHFGDMSQCERCEKLIFTFIGVPGRGKAKPTCKAEDRRSTSRKFDWHTFCQRHYFADMSQYWDMSDPHFLGLRHDWSLHWGWEIQSQKTRLSHFWPLKLATFWGDVTMLRDIRLTLFVSPHAKGRDAYFLRFQGRERVGAHN